MTHGARRRGGLECRPVIREFCWTCHRPAVSCFCAMARPFESSPEFALVVHPDEVKSTVGTAWIIRRSISNLRWFRSKGTELDEDPAFVETLESPGVLPLLLFPGPGSLNLNRASSQDWRSVVSESQRPLFIVIDGTWTQASAMLRKSARLRSLPRVSFEPGKLSEYGFKIQPHPACLSSVEGVHRVMEVMAERGWGSLPASREHDQMIEIFRGMVRFQMTQEKNPRFESRMLTRKL